jgi:hypothetical protein
MTPAAHARLRRLCKLAADVTFYRYRSRGVAVVAEALREIRDKKLWRGRTRTFADYCKSRLGMTPTEARAFLRFKGAPPTPPRCNAVAPPSTGPDFARAIQPRTRRTP